MFKNSFRVFYFRLKTYQVKNLIDTGKDFIQVSNFVPFFSDVSVSREE